MDYEKRYKEALEQAKKELAQSGPDSDSARQIKRFFPELIESEDEKIRKWILEKVQGYANSGIPCPDEIQIANKALAYLEKQKEQKPVEWRYEDSVFLRDCARLLEENGYVTCAERLRNLNANLLREKIVHNENNSSELSTDVCGCNSCQ